uniref:Uncharacterized protein n=1 Tax=Raoultella planticola TaxID=575 RepID=W8CUP7_RAOPL|nr:hypothetical protein pKpNDM1_00365 [Raoultella planticola]
MVINIILTHGIMVFIRSVKMPETQPNRYPIAIILKI